MGTDPFFLGFAIPILYLLFYPILFPIPRKGSGVFNIISIRLVNGNSSGSSIGSGSGSNCGSGSSSSSSSSSGSSTSARIQMYTIVRIIAIQLLNIGIKSLTNT